MTRGHWSELISGGENSHQKSNRHWQNGKKLYTRKMTQTHKEKNLEKKNNWKVYSFIEIRLYSLLSFDVIVVV
jgi:hypothetical protein